MSERLLINIVVPGLAFDGRALSSQSLGGSETAGLCVARELVRLGDKVTLFCNCAKQEETDGVGYAPLELARACYLVPHDVTVVQRMPEFFGTQTQSKLNVLWQHDLALGRNKTTFCGALWNVDKVILLSEYHRDQYRAVYGLDDGIMHVGRNGIDLDLFEKAADGERDPHQLIYAARPERGLDVLLREVLPELLRRDPKFRLSIAAYHNPVEHMKAFYREIDRLIASFGDRVSWLGALPKRTLYEHYARAGLYVYPTPSPTMPDFQEISCITALECQAAGLPFIGTRNGALPETCQAIDDASGGLCLVDPGPDYIQRFCDAVMLFTDDRELWTAVSEAGQKHARTLGWDGVARDFHDLFVREIKRANANPETLAHHLWARSDIIALEALCATNR